MFVKATEILYLHVDLNCIGICIKFILLKSATRQRYELLQWSVATSGREDEQQQEIWTNISGDRPRRFKHITPQNSRDASSHSTSQWIPRGTLKVHYHVHKSQAQCHILSHVNPVHILTPYSLTVRNSRDSSVGIVTGCTAGVRSWQR
jgi:hypothetical protein